MVVRWMLCGAQRAFQPHTQSHTTDSLQMSNQSATKVARDNIARQRLLTEFNSHTPFPTETNYNAELKQRPSRQPLRASDSRSQPSTFNPSTPSFDIAESTRNPVFALQRNDVIKSNSNSRRGGDNSSLNQSSLAQRLDQFDNVYHTTTITPVTNVNQASTTTTLTPDSLR